MQIRLYNEEGTNLNNNTWEPLSHQLFWKKIASKADEKVKKKTPSFAFQFSRIIFLDLETDQQH